jgi:hypothetical protein
MHKIDLTLVNVSRINIPTRVTTTKPTLLPPPRTLLPKKGLPPFQIGVILVTGTRILRILGEFMFYIKSQILILSKH